MESILELRGIVKRFPGVTALDGVDLSISKSEIHALVGQNGAGKSALIKVLSGAYPADEGEMRFQGAPFQPRTPLDALRAGIRVVHQEFNQLPYLSVAENLLFEKLPRRFGVLLDRGTLERRAAALLNRSVSISTRERASNALESLSGNSWRSQRRFRLPADCWSWMNRQRHSRHVKLPGCLKLSAQRDPLE